MKLFDIVGPVMIGPSSSHTAGAVKIGLIARKLLGEKPVKAEILLHGSFAMTGSGHGTDRAIVAGIMGIRPDDERIPESFEIAHAGGLGLLDRYDTHTQRPSELDHDQTARRTWQKTRTRRVFPRWRPNHRIPHRRHHIAFFGDETPDRPRQHDRPDMSHA